MHVIPVMRIRSLLVAAVVLASSATAARAHFTIDYPNGGEELVVGSVFTITWHIEDAHSPMNWGIWYSTTGVDGPWTSIAFGLPPGSGEAGSIHTYDWTVPDVVDDTVWVMIWMNNPGYEDDYTEKSDAPFSIVLHPACPADLDGDGTVDAFDLAQLLGSWGPCDDCEDCPADFNDDCAVNAADLAQLLGNWGPCL